MKTPMKLVQVCTMPRTWLQVPVNIPDDTVKRKYLKLKAERDERSNKFQRWTGKDNT
jgi:hypothetical protein